MIQKKINKALFIFLISLLGILLIYGSTKDFYGPPKNIEPFWLENYEIIQNPSSIKLYFNRDIVKEEMVEMELSICVHDTNCISNVVKIEQTNEGKCLFKTEDYPEFKNVIEQHLNQTDTIISVIGTFESSYGTYPWMIVERGVSFRTFHSPAEDIENYTKEDRQINEIERNSLSDSRKWMMSFWRYSKGKFDNQGKKQGDWKWQYFNGNILAKTDFIDDKITSLLTLYCYDGQIRDSIFYNSEGNMTEWKHYEPSGEISMDKKY